MTTTMNRFKGIHAVLYALFDKQGQLDKAAMKDQVQYCLDGNIDGITLLGLATEVQKLSFEEQRQLIAWVQDTIGSKVPLSITISGDSITQQQQMARFACDNGADWLILQPPIMGSYPGDTYLDFFLSVVEGINIPFSIQNAPAYLGRSLTNSDIERLMQANPNFALIKAETSAVDLATLTERVAGKLIVLNGRGGLELTDCLRAKADGFVVAPDVIDYTKKAYNHWQAGEYDKAEETYKQVLPAMTFIMQSIEHLICYGKRVYGLRTNTPIYDRAPAINTSEFGLKLAQQWSQKLGMLFSKN